MTELTMETIEDAKAPPAPKPGASAPTVDQKQADAFVKQVGDGKATGSITFDPNDKDLTARAIKVRLWNAGKRLGLAVQSWDVGNKVYFKVTGVYVKKGSKNSTPAAATT